MEIQFILTSINFVVFLISLFFCFFIKIEHIYTTQILKEIRAEVINDKVKIFLLWEDNTKTKIKPQEIKNYKAGETYTFLITERISLKNPFKK